MISIAIIDDHEIVRIGLRTILSQVDDIEVLCEYASGEEVRNQIAYLEEAVDIILLDLELPDVHDLELLSYLHSNLTRPKILILTSHSEEEYAVRAVFEGARGFLSKTFDIDVLKNAIVSVLNGGIFLSPNATRLLKQGIENQESDSQSRGSFLESLSEKEQEVFHHICSGLSVKEIAFEMDCSMKSISTYKSRLMEKLRCRSLVDIIIIGIESGYITHDREFIQEYAHE